MEDLAVRLSGRVAIVAKKANFDLVRERYPRWLSTTTSVFGLAVCLITLFAELGGLGLIMHYVLGWNEGFFTLIGLLVIVASSLLLSFSMIERIFGYLGLGLAVFTIAALHHGPAWHAIGRGGGATAVEHGMPGGSRFELKWDGFIH